MKTLNLVTAASVTFLLASASAFAQVKNDTGMDSPSQMGRYDTPVPSEMKAADEAGGVMQNTYKEIKATMITDDPKTQPFAISIDENMTARGMIGKPVYNQDRERIAIMSDIILDQKGMAQMVVLKNGDFAGLGGNLVALGYDIILDYTQNGDVVIPVSGKKIDKAAEFSYKSDGGGNVRTVPENGYSVARLLEGKLLAFDGTELANIDNVSFRDERAFLVVAVYNQIFYMGGERAAVDFNTMALVRDQDDINLKLSKTQTEHFQNLKSGQTQKLGRAY